MIQTAIMGHGVVGSGVAEILLQNNNLINQKIKDEINVKYILDLREFNDVPYSDKFIKDFNIIANDDEIKIVVEVMGGINPAYDFVKRLLLSGKSVVTSNKELVAAKGKSITVQPYDMASAEPVEVDGEVIGKAPVRFDVLDSQVNVVAIKQD